MKVNRVCHAFASAAYPRPGERIKSFPRPWCVGYALAVVVSAIVCLFAGCAGVGTPVGLVTTV